MILPSKHANSDRTLVVLGGRVLPLMEEPRELGELWGMARAQGFVSSFERFYSTVLFLFMIGAIEIDRGLLMLRGSE